MNIGFDIDGTLTNFEDFIIRNKKYIEKKYGFTLTNPNGYDVDEMFEIKKKLLEKGLDEELAIKKANDITNSFWNKYYLKYLLFSMKKNISKNIKYLKKDGNKVYIITSRKKVCEKSFIGKMVKYSTIFTLKLHKIKYDKIIFCADDEEKIKTIIDEKIDIMIDDKPDVINIIKDYVKCICINANYNNNIDENIIRVENFDNLKVYTVINKEIEKSKNNMNYDNLTFFPNIKRNERFYKLTRTISKRFIKAIFKPIILNPQNMINEKPVIYAANHRKTLDPFLIFISSSDAIHWAALKRFFTGDDSIFNNSKNPFLCKITSIIFKEMGLVPVDRNGDNKEMIELFNYYLQKKCSVGIFPEGTTNKHPDNNPLLDIKNGTFYFAKNNDANIQPISIVWFPKSKKIKNRVIINYGKSFSMKDLTIMEGKEKWEKEILKGIKECENIINEIISNNEENEFKINRR